MNVLSINLDPKTGEATLLMRKQLVEGSEYTVRKCESVTEALDILMYNWKLASLIVDGVTPPVVLSSSTHKEN